MLRKVLFIAALCGLLSPGLRAEPVTYFTLLDGASEVPANASPGHGQATVIIDEVLHTMRLLVTFADLTSGVTAAHIHCCIAGANPGTSVVATTTPSFLGFPSGVTSGSYDHTFDLDLASTYRTGFINSFGSVAGAKAAFLGALDDGTAYLNIHTTNFQGGEIRGFLQAVPEPGSLALMAAAGMVLGAGRRRRLKTAAA